MESEQKTSSKGFGDLINTPIEEFLKVLYEHKKSWEKEGKFQEALDTVKRIEELRMQEDKRQRQELEKKPIKKKFRSSYIDGRRSLSLNLRMKDC